MNKPTTITTENQDHTLIEQFYYVLSDISESRGQGNKSHSGTIKTDLCPNTSPVYGTKPKSEWHTMPDQYVLEHIRDLLADQKIAITAIDETVRQWILHEMGVPNRDKARFYNIITELRKQEGHYTELPIVTEEQSDVKYLDLDYDMFDQLTPVTHIKKQNELIITDEYIRYICDCFAFLRHDRDRAERDAEKEMFHMIENEENMKSIKIRNEKEWVLQEECAKIHSYFLHSTIQYQNTDLLTNQTEANKTVDEISDYAMGRSFSAMTLSPVPSTTLSAISDKSNHATVSSKHKETLIRPPPKPVVRLGNKSTIQDEKIEEDRKKLENKLHEFFNWKMSLLTALAKFGAVINGKVILNPAEMMAFYGPLSSTLSYHVAKTFVTLKGMVLQIRSRYPRLKLCRAFDALCDEFGKESNLIRMDGISDELKQYLLDPDPRDTITLFIKPDNQLKQIKFFYYNDNDASFEAFGKKSNSIKMDCISDELKQYWLDPDPGQSNDGQPTLYTISFANISKMYDGSKYAVMHDKPCGKVDDDYGEKQNVSLNPKTEVFMLPMPLNHDEEALQF